MSRISRTKKPSRPLRASVVRLGPDDGLGASTRTIPHPAQHPTSIAPRQLTSSLVLGAFYTLCCDAQAWTSRRLVIYSRELSTTASSSIATRFGPRVLFHLTLLHCTPREREETWHGVTGIQQTAFVYREHGATPFQCVHAPFTGRCYPGQVIDKT